MASVSMAARESFFCSTTSRARTKERSLAVRKAQRPATRDQIDAAPGILRRKLFEDRRHIGALRQAAGEIFDGERLGRGEQQCLGNPQRFAMIGHLAASSRTASSSRSSVMLSILRSCVHGFGHHLHPDRREGLVLTDAQFAFPHHFQGRDRVEARMVGRMDGSTMNSRR